MKNWIADRDELLGALLGRAREAARAVKAPDDRGRGEAVDERACAVDAVADDAALLTLELPPRPQAPMAARKALTSLNGAMQLVSEARLRDAQLMVSELVANAVRHGGDGEHPVRLEVRATDEALRVAVIDVGPGFAPERLAAASWSASWRRRARFPISSMHGSSRS